MNSQELTKQDFDDCQRDQRRQDSIDEYQHHRENEDSFSSRRRHLSSARDKRNYSWVDKSNTL